MSSEDFRETKFEGVIQLLTVFKNAYKSLKKILYSQHLFHYYHNIYIYILYGEINIYDIINSIYIYIYN